MRPGRRGFDMRTISAKELVKEMRIGWNLGDTMDSVNDSIDRTSAPQVWETAWKNPVTEERLIAKIIDEGFNVIRYPVSWRNHLGEAPEYKIEETWMNRVQELVDWAYNRGAFVILNMEILSLFSAINKTNVNLTIEDFAGKPLVSFLGIPIKCADQIKNDEKVVV